MVDAEGEAGVGHRLLDPRPHLRARHPLVLQAEGDIAPDGLRDNGCRGVLQEQPDAARRPHRILAVVRDAPRQLTVVGAQQEAGESA